jgi:hypothetical protein
MWNRRKEALAMFNICTLVRDQLNKEQVAGEPIEDILKRLIGFYQVTTQKLAMLVMQADRETQTKHLSHVLQTSIQAYVAHDEYIDFPTLREYLTATWPDMDVEGAFNPPTKPVFFTHSGKEVCADPNFNVLLEKVAPDLSEVSSAKVNPFGTPNPDSGQDVVIDRTADIQAKLWNFWNHTKDGVIGPMDFEWAHDFPMFEKWALDNGFKQGMAILRKDPQGGYTPDNCYVVKRETPNRSGHQNIRDL